MLCKKNYTTTYKSDKNKRFLYFSRAYEGHGKNSMIKMRTL